MAKVTITVNGVKHTKQVEDRTLLANFLRDELGLTGTHIGCDTSQCGCCTVHVNGRAVKSCTMVAAQAEGAQVTTIEGMAKKGKLHPIQQAFSECHGKNACWIGCSLPFFAMPSSRHFRSATACSAGSARQA